MEGLEARPFRAANKPAADSQAFAYEETQEVADRMQKVRS